MNYSKALIKVREDLGLSQRKFADLVDVDHAYISRLEQGYRGKEQKPIYPSIEVLKQICDKSKYPFRKFLEEAGYIEKVDSLPIPKNWDKLSDFQKQYVLKQIDELIETLLEVEEDKQTYMLNENKNIKNF